MQGSSPSSSSSSSSMETSGSSIWKTSLDWDRRFDASTNSGEVALAGEAGIADGRYLADLVKSSDAGSAQLRGLVKQWESTHRNAVRMLTEELDALNAQKDEAEKKRRRIFDEDFFLKLEAQRSFVEPWMMDEEEEEDLCSSCGSLSSLEDSCEEVDEPRTYWKSRAMKLNRLLRESLRREAVLSQKLRRKFLDDTVGGLEKHLERVDNFLHFILRNSPILLCHQDKELRYRFVYNQHPSIQPEDVIGKHALDVYNGKNAQETVAFKEKVLRRGKPARQEFVYQDEKFGVKAFLLCCEPVFSRSGEVIGVNSANIDITEEFLNRERNAVIREEAAVQRTLELEMQKTMRITEEIMKSKQLLAELSHEIRSPLVAIFGAADLLSSMKLDSEQRMLVDTMVDSGEMVMQLINDILDLSKVESGAMKLECTKFRPREVVRGVLQTAATSPYVRNKADLTLEGVVCDDVPIELSGDVLRLRQILTNLVSNASKFTEHGTVKVTVRVVGDSRDGTMCLEYEVFDTGIGIPEAALPFLFSKYMQASVTHARKYGGTGLGLAICKELVELMGGNLRVASKEGRGSTFTFTVTSRIVEDWKTCPSDSIRSGHFKFYPNALSSTNPVHNSAPKVDRPCSLPTGDNASQRNFGGLKVLLAEDNKVIVMVAQSMLKKLGLEAKVVSNGAEAVQAVRQDYYDLVLMDICMPVMDGLEATRLIRAHEESHPGSSRTSIVALTANSFEDSIDGCYGNGMDSFIPKPVTFSRLQQVIHQLLPARRTVRAGAQNCS